MNACDFCPRRCGADRTIHNGLCGAGRLIRVGSIVVHRGEEPPLIQGAGSGAVFLSGCQLRCSYCQNKQISHGSYGRDLTPAELSAYLFKLKERGCSNINLVTPLHYSEQLLETLDLSVGLDLPVVINSGGYESVATLKRWREHADVYLLDIKYGDDAAGQLLSGVPDYWQRVREAVEYVFETKGPLEVDADGRAVRGLMIRHLVLPGMLSNPFAVLEFLAELSLDIPLSLMCQYNPAFYEGQLAEMQRSLEEDEYQTVIDKALDLGFETLFVQSSEACETYVPDFGAERPFGDADDLLNG